MQGSGERPTHNDYAEARPVFEEVLATLQPHAVLVVGKGAWGGLGNMQGVMSLTYAIRQSSLGPRVSQPMECERITPGVESKF